MDLDATVARLARVAGAPSPVVSVYLNTRWRDEDQRERVRLFLKNELRRARATAADPALRSDLDWVEAQGAAVVGGGAAADAHGVALFACAPLGLRERLEVRVPFEDAFVVAPEPYLTPLAAALAEIPGTLVAFVDGERARLIPVTVARAGEEVVLESDVPGHHRRGGWALLAQARYQRHIQAHRGQHFDAVAEALLRLVEERGLDRIVLAGEPRTLAVFRDHLPRAVAERVVGSVPGAHYEPARTLAERATVLVARVEAEATRAAVEAVLTEAAKGGRAVAGLEETLVAAARGAVQRLYLHRGFAEPGGECPACGTAQPGAGPACRLCGGPVRSVELGRWLVDRVLAAGGTAEVVEGHAGLAQAGGVAARLRYPL